MIRALALAAALFVHVQPGVTNETPIVYLSPSGWSPSQVVVTGRSDGRYSDCRWQGGVQLTNQTPYGQHVNWSGPGLMPGSGWVTSGGTAMWCVGSAYRGVVTVTAAGHVLRIVDNGDGIG